MTATFDELEAGFEFEPEEGFAPAEVDGTLPVALKAGVKTGVKAAEGRAVSAVIGALAVV
jgi:hypothetical protein